MLSLFGVGDEGFLAFDFEAVDDLFCFCEGDGDEGEFVHDLDVGDVLGFHGDSGEDEFGEFFGGEVVVFSERDEESGSALLVELLAFGCGFVDSAIGV